MAVTMHLFDHVLEYFMVTIKDIFASIIIEI